MNIHHCRFIDYTPHTITATSFCHPLRLAIGRSNGDIELWNPRTMIQELLLPGAQGRTIEGLVWATLPNEPPRLFSIGGSTAITEWDLARGVPRTNYDCNAGIIWSIDVSADQKRLAVGCDDGSVVIVDLSGGVMEHVMVCQRQEARVLAIKWSDELLIGGCSDGHVRVWDAADRGRLVSSNRVDKSRTESTLVWSVAVVPSKSQFMTGDSTGSVKIWDLRTFTLAQTFALHEADVLALATDGESLFSAGVDRKIHQYTAHDLRWVHNSSRLLHANDVRTMALSKGRTHDILVSGGVESTLVVQSTHDFQHGRYTKLGGEQRHLAVNAAKRLVVMWQDQLVKIWRILDGGVYRLVCKMTLQDEGNIVGCSLAAEGDILAVARADCVRLFRLEDTGDKLVVSKIRDPLLDDISAKWVHVSTSRLVVLTADEEIHLYAIEDSIKLVREIELETSPAKPLPYYHCINNMCMSPDEKMLVLSRHNGSVERVSLDEEVVNTLATLSEYPLSLAFTNNDSVVVATADAAVYELCLSGEGLLSDWSRRNSANVPEQVRALALKGGPQGVFDHDNKIWIYGPSWIAFYDKSVDLPVKKAQKRDRDDEESDEELDKSFGVLDKYRGIMGVCGLGDDIAVFEWPKRDAKRFNLVKYRF